jgi:transmembrane sensor
MNTNDRQRAEIEAAAWVARQDRLCTAWSESDEGELQAWLGQDTSHRVAWLRLQEGWQRADRAARCPAVKVASTVKPAARRFFWPAGVLAAAAALWWLAPVWVGQQPAMSGDPISHETAVGAREILALADGSRVTLNTNTRGRSEIDGQMRRFWLDQGEAFFDIKHDEARPFVVMAGEDRITVLGTRFSVRLELGRTRVTVLEGRVRVSHANERATDAFAPTELGPGMGAVSRPEGTLVAPRTEAEMLRDLSWREGRLVFDQLTLAEIAAEFNRYNRRQLIVDPELAGLRLGGSFDAHNLDGFVRLLHEGFGVVSHVDGDQLRLTAR